MSFEQTIIQGNLGGDPELKYTGDGKPVCNFSVAVTRRRASGEQTVWYRVAAWEGLGENCAKYLKKGSAVLVLGRPDARAYTGKDGQPAASLDLTAFDVRFLSKAQTDGESAGYDAPPADAKDIPF